jgi:hypothetical protein
MVREHLRASSLIPFLICVKILFVGHSLTFGLAKEFNADKKRDKRRCTQIGQCGSDRAGPSRRNAAYHLFPDRLLEQLSIRLHHPARQRTTAIARKAMQSPRFARDDDNPAKADFQRRRITTRQVIR